MIASALRGRSREGKAAGDVSGRPRRDATTPNRGGRAQDGSDGREEGVRVSVVIPTYNERENIRAVIERVRSAVAHVDFEIIVVDDDSPDGTWRVVREEYDSSEVRAIRRRDATGLATAVLRGFAEASGDVAVVLDGDLQHPPERLPDLLAAFEPGVDIVVGTRYSEDGGVRNWSLSRRVVSAGATRIARLSVPDARGITDPLSGFFAVRREILPDAELSPVGFKILLEILSRCEYDRVVEMPYVFDERKRGESKLNATEYVGFIKHVGSLAVTSRG